MKKHTFLRAQALLLSLLLLTLLPFSALAEEGGGETEGGGTGETVPVTSVSLAPDQVILPQNGDRTATLIATVHPRDASDQSITWSSSDPAVAEVNSSGTVTAKAPGEATVTATTRDGGHKAACTVTVSGLVLSDTRLRLVTNNSVTLGKTLYGDARNVSTWNWSSSRQDVARVSPSGQVTGLSEGTAVITCQNESGTYSAPCTVEVGRNEAATVRGSLSGGILELERVESSMERNCSALMGSSLSYVTGLFVPTDAGILHYGYVSPSDTGPGVASSQRYYVGGGSGEQLSEVVFVPKAGYSGTAVIGYTGFTAGGQSYTGEILVEVEAAEQTLSYTSEGGEAVQFQASDFSDYCQALNGRPIKYVTFSLPASRYGMLYYNYTGSDVYESNVDEDTQYGRTGSPSISNVFFVPDPDYRGTFSLSYRGCDSSGKTFRDSVRITVDQSSGSGDGGPLTYTARPGQRVYFDVDDFSELSYDETGYQLSYVRFTLPSSSKGVLYYNGSTKVTSSTSYYRTGSGRRLEDVSFIPDEDFDGTVKISFTGYDTRGDHFEGAVRVEVSEDGDAAPLSYSVRPGQRVYFDTDDFSDLSYDETGYQLDYVRFTLPSSSRGVLYYDGNTKVSASTSYYRTGSGKRLLEDVSFLADDDFDGTVKIDFTGYDTRGNDFDGTVKITVSGTGGSGLTYDGYAGRRLYLDADDFSDYSYDETGYQLNYIRFTPPSSSRGVLYYQEDTKVTSGTSYYRTGSGKRLLEDVSFVPDKNFSGTVSISFTGRDTRGNDFDGTVRVDVSKAQAVTVSYVTTGPALTFRTSDFTAACADSLPGALSRVQIVPPDAGAGRLYVNYASPLSWTAYDAQQRYYVSGTPSISQLSFVPKAGFSGSVHLSFTGTDAKGNTCSDTIRIQVTPPARSAYFTDMGAHAWAVPAADFLRYYGIVNGTTSATYAPSQPLRRGDFVLMLSRAFAFPAAGTASFYDVPQSSHYAAALASAKALGVIDGDSRGNFQPNAPLTRQAAAVILYRCMQTKGTVTSGTSADLSRFADASQVSSYAVEAMGSLVRQGIFTGNAAGQLKPGAALSRAEMAVILHRAFT